MRLWPVALVLLSACSRYLPAPVPMRSISWSQSAGKPKARCLVVFLPGAGDAAEDFARNGFVDEVNKRELAVDMVAAHATLGYYSRGLLTDRLAADVVGPARAQGYDQLWLIGMSMGGMGTLLYARTHASDVTGVLALAPYLGDDALIDEIQAQGGLAGWKAPARADKLTEDNYQRELWRWLKAVTGGSEPGPMLYLAYGKADRLARADELVAARLRPEQVLLGEGGHAWTVWRELFGRFLDDSAFSRACK